MLINYIKIAVRNLLKHKLFSFINVAGLTLGSTCFLLIAMYIFSQYQYDTHHTAVDNLYRVETNMQGKAFEFNSATLSPPILPVMHTEFPEILNASRLVGVMDVDKSLFKWKDNFIYETKGYYADSTFFSLFDYNWVEGQAKNALQDPFTLVLTKASKEKLFGDHPALGEIIEINDVTGKNNFTVTGVVDQSKHKSHIRPNYYIAMRSGGIGEYVRTNGTWSGNNFVYGYVQLHSNTDPKDLEAKLPAFLQKHGGDELKASGTVKTLTLQPVRDIHLHSTKEAQLDTVGNLSLLNILLLIAGFILLIACVNFMNLSTAKSLKRRVEVGIRKTIGANRSSIIQQFYVESFLVAGISFLLAIFFSFLIANSNSNFIAQQIDFNNSVSPLTILIMLGIYLVIAFVAGSYPALYLSSFKPVTIIKGLFKKSKGQNFIRKSLVVLQFTISIGMIVGSMIILNQLRFMQNKDLGFDKKQKIIIPFNTTESRTKISAFKNEITALPEVINAAGSRTHPGTMVLRDFNVYAEGGSMDQAKNVKLVQGDENFIETLGIKLLSGRNVATHDTLDITNVLINQTALRTFNIDEENALEQKLYSKRGAQSLTTYNIVGVVQDYHQGSLKNEINSSIIAYTPDRWNYAVVVNAKFADSKNLIASLENIWNQSIADIPFEYHFLDEKFQSQYEQEFQLAKIINVFTFIAIFISCLGLFGLSIYIAEQRKKEIGIRKVLGASINGLIFLLTKGFIKLIVIALLLAIPIAWYFMDGWLNEFAYRVNIEWWMFLLTGLIAIGIGLLTVGVNSMKAALSNPVESIKTD